MGPKKQPDTVFTLSDDQLESLADKVTQKLEARMKKREEHVDGRLDELCLVTDELEQHNRLENLRIFGVKEVKGENTDKIVIDVAKKIGITLASSSISRSHRVGPISANKTRALIVKFVSYADRKNMFKAKKLLKGTGITVAEDLTRYRRSILTKATEVYSKGNVWSDNGIIVIKIGNTFHRVKTLYDLEELNTKHPPS